MNVAVFLFSAQDPQELSTDACSLPSQRGSCNTNFNNTIRYYFHSLQGECLLFVYSGCGGNRNNFRSKKECQKKCGKIEGLVCFVWSMVAFWTQRTNPTGTYSLTWSPNNERILNRDKHHRFTEIKLVSFWTQGQSSGHWVRLNKANMWLIIKKLTYLPDCESRLYAKNIFLIQL